MNYRNFKHSGKDVSLLGFGTMRLPVHNSDDSKINEAEAIKMIRFAIDSGVNYVDTAYVYHGGNSEIVLGKALKDGYREKVMIADKMPLWELKEDGDADKYFNEQLTRLDVDCIDMYLLHNITTPLWKIANKHDVISFCEKKKAEGKIKHIGFSFHDELDLFKEVIDAYPWDFCQIQLNYMDQKYQAGVEGLKYAASKGIPVIVMEPLKGGRLTDAVPESIKKFWTSAPTPRTPAEWALKWVANFSEVLTILSGMTTMSQVKDNLKILSDAEPNSLTDVELALVDKACDEYNKLIKASCTSCKYCLPCPVKINIPEYIGRYNEWFLYDKHPKMIDHFKAFSNPKARPSHCTACKACEEKCPQHLPIVDLLVKTREIFEA